MARLASYGCAEPTTSFKLPALGCPPTPPPPTHTLTNTHTSTLPSLPCRALQVAEAWGAAASSSPFLTDVALQTQRLTLDIVGLVAFSHDFGQAQQAIRCVREGEEGAGASKPGNSPGAVAATCARLCTCLSKWMRVAGAALQTTHPWPWPLQGPIGAGRRGVCSAGPAAVGGEHVWGGAGAGEARRASAGGSGTAKLQWSKKLHGWVMSRPDAWAAIGLHQQPSNYLGGLALPSSLGSVQCSQNTACAHSL